MPTSGRRYTLCGVWVGFHRLRAASFFLSDQKETKESPGTVAFGKDLRLTPWSFLRHFSPEPRFYGGVRRSAGNRGRRGAIRKGVQRLSLPFSSMDRTTCFYKMICA